MAKQNRDYILHVRLTRTERQMLAKAAKREGISQSRLVRRVLAQMGSSQVEPEPQPLGRLIRGR